MKVYFTCGVITLIALVTSQFVSACTCFEPEKPLDTLTIHAFEAADLIVEGRVISLKYASAGTPSKHGGVIRSTADPIRAIIAVSKFYKGEIDEDTIEVITAMDEMTCGYPFKKGLNYLIYINDTDQFTQSYAIENRLNTDLCTRTEVLDRVDERELGILMELSLSWNESLE